MEVWGSLRIRAGLLVDALAVASTLGPLASRTPQGRRHEAGVGSEHRYVQGSSIRPNSVPYAWVRVNDGNRRTSGTPTSTPSKI